MFYNTLYVTMRTENAFVSILSTASLDHLIDLQPGPEAETTKSESPAPLHHNHRRCFCCESQQWLKESAVGVRQPSGLSISQAHTHTARGAWVGGTSGTAEERRAAD